jgi:hypothetical protein
VTEGVCFVAYGAAARKECQQAIRALRRHHDWPITVVAEGPIEGVRHVYAPRLDPGARLAKLNLDTVSPYDHTLYMDADTRTKGDLSAGFAVLADGWDIALAPSPRQDGDALGNCPEADREATWAALGARHVLALQAGVMFWRRCEAVSRLFAAWREEWRRFRQMDQAALLRALWRAPVRVWILGSEWNGARGELVTHGYGRAAR